VVIQNNEGKACDAVVKLLEERIGTDRADISHPETNGIGPPVDLRLKLGAQNYAIEHTRIEAFEGQIRRVEKLNRFINPVIDELSEKLPGPAVYDLYFPDEGWLGVNANELDEIRDDFIEWVRKHAQHLHEKNPDRPTREQNPDGFCEQYRGTPPEFPCEVTLQREAHWSHSSQHDGVLFVSLVAPKNVEALRADRLRRALERKCPKLQGCKEDGARTVLVLEDGDIFLSNRALIRDQLARLLEDHADLPDEIYLVKTPLNRWTVRLMKYDECYLPEEDRTQFISAELTDITGAGEDQNQ
jgi:hypothetical protein